MNEVLTKHCIFSVNTVTTHALNKSTQVKSLTWLVCQRLMGTCALIKI